MPEPLYDNSELTNIKTPMETPNQREPEQLCFDFCKDEYTDEERKIDL